MLCLHRCSRSWPLMDLTPCCLGPLHSRRWSLCQAVRPCLASSRVLNTNYCHLRLEMGYLVGPHSAAVTVAQQAAVYCTRGATSVTLLLHYCLQTSCQLLQLLLLLNSHVDFLGFGSRSDQSQWRGRCAQCTCTEPQTQNTAMRCTEKNWTVWQTLGPVLYH
jgi:hypothetical protein